MFWVDFGNITDRIALRQRLDCTSFEWYLKNIFPERHVPLRYEAFGMVRNEYVGRGRMCLHGDFDASRDNGVHAPLKVKHCVDKQKFQVGVFDFNSILSLLHLKLKLHFDFSISISEKKRENCALI